ncbi:alpha-E domain-containing protein [Flectobacillus longus]|uniref:Alpha-E domain-containing protein n=1 Tax=Flectobacillus longus TaxID=2984207 RepID=A0ABT6YLN9_9BACT|nr:alpha-E domain-containing protein [Flectobacillus longus]MDI9864501.1 alpha-E domain-containing protein [Flectobacillus longus]MDI9880196.1 alpha-E domain-containing protein [Flectobacillus longus]
MLSRVANSIYWMNRYIERADNYARFISVNFNLALDLPPNVPEQWEPLIIATADHFIFKEHYDEPTRENILYFMTFDVRNPNSILSCLLNARENARTIRESISKEMWEYVNQIYWTVKNATHESKSWELSQYQGFLENIKTGSQLFYGIVDSTITRGEGWHFGRLGRLIERTDKTTRFLDVKYFTLLPSIESIGSPLDLMLWSAVLRSVSAYNMFRQQYPVMHPTGIVEFLLLDKRFPRSVMHCLRQAELSLYEISGTSVTNGYSNDAEKAISKLRSEVEFTEIEDIFEIGLHQYLDEFQTKNNGVGRAIFETYFDLKPVVSE